jgi:glycosyltransferase involved in cell wall biosynthesis
VRDPDGFRALVAYLRRSQFDVAFGFVMGGPDDLVGLDAAALAAVPVAVAYVGWTISIPPGLPIDALELPSDVLVGLQPPGGAYRLARIYSPLDLDALNPARFKPRSRHVLQRLVVGRLSRLVPEKNPQTFILVAAEVKKFLLARSKADAQQLTATHSGSQLIADVFMLLPRFILAGDGPLREELVSLGPCMMTEVPRSLLLMPRSSCLFLVHRLRWPRLMVSVTSLSLLEK